MPHHYAVNVRYSPEDAAFIADVPELPGCMADGESLTAAVAAAEEAIEDWIGVAREMGRNVPEPDVSKRYGGRLLLRLPRFLHRSLDEAAQRNGTSINTHVVALLAASVGARSVADIALQQFLYVWRAASAATSTMQSAALGVLGSYGHWFGQGPVLRTTQTTTTTLETIGH